MRNERRGRSFAGFPISTPTTQEEKKEGRKREREGESESERERGKERERGGGERERERIRKRKREIEVYHERSFTVARTAQGKTVGVIAVLEPGGSVNGGGREVRVAGGIIHFAGVALLRRS